MEVEAGTDMVDWQPWVLADEDTDTNQTAKHIPLPQIAEENAEVALSPATLATHDSCKEVAAQTGEATDRSTNASAAEDQGSRSWSQVKEEFDCDADPESSGGPENHDLLPHWYSSPEGIACNNSIFSMRSEEQATAPRKGRTLSGWYGEQAGVEVAHPPSTNTAPNQDNFVGAGEALCHYHDLSSFQEEAPNISSFQMQLGSKATSGDSLMAGG